MRPSSNVIEQTWLAYSLERDPPADDVERRVRRVGAHYGELIADRLTAHHRRAGGLGLALWARDDERLRWPLWCELGNLTAAMSAVPTGWRRLVGDEDPATAAPALATHLADHPEDAARLNPPFAVGVLRDGSAPELTIVGDLLGAGRLYEMDFDGGRVWSNRLGALPLFAEVAPEPDRQAWAVFAAAGWFLGETTPIAGARKVPPGSVLRIRGGRTEASSGDPRRDVVEPRRVRFGQVADLAAREVLEMAQDMGTAWATPIAISLTGGRDSRVSAAAAVAAGIEATYNTGDQVPGEVEVVRQLVASAPRVMDHTVHHPEAGDGEADLRERIRRIHLVHDGMRNPQEVRRPSEVPQAHWPPPTLSGHGGELGHGFYYPRKERLRKLKRGGDRAIRAQLERNARRRHSAATDEAYAVYLAECERTLDQGHRYGLRGPVLLDWFYMAQRLPYRSGLGARSGRSSTCVAPAFMRGAFDLRPKDRLRAKLHREVVARLVPDWSGVEFFRSDDAAMPEIHRARIWERPAEVADVEAILASDRGWPEMFEAERVKRMWREVRGGGGSADYEHVFYRVVWRAGFEAHLELLGRRIGDR